MTTRLAWLPLLLSLGGCQHEPSPPPEARPVRTVTVGTFAAGESGSYAGEVRSRHESTLSFRTGGLVLERSVQPGDRVQKGQVLARLDDVDARLNATSADAALASARSEFLQAEVDFERAQRLHEQRFISPAEFDRDRVQLDAARARWQSAQAEHALAANQREYAQLRAPWDGIVTEVDIESGQVVSAGQPVVTLAADERREVQVAVPESQLETFRNASRFDVELWARPQRRYAGRLRELAPMTDGRTRQYMARIALDDADADVGLGMTARVHVVGSDARPLVRLPLGALLQRGDATYVWVVAWSEQQVHARRITVDSVSQESVLVSAGLAVGDEVVTAGVHQLTEGQRVRRASVATSPAASERA
ncbi:MAG TPA: efflux RND transporter periplasmic adaptor subunit [Steroidobacteraceae bacterium]|jgi:multidrug efflux system membrane fusion protein|nr:efflux RND transporter periplasmic adaptor subunit [Steroidobacteraceae bacterium]